MPEDRWEEAMLKMRQAQKALADSRERTPEAVHHLTEAVRLLGQEVEYLRRGVVELNPAYFGPMG